jgi:hypothetical protein
MEKDEKLITLKRIENEIDAISLRDYLKMQGIEACIIVYHDTMFDGISQDWGEGMWGEVQVLQHNLTQANSALEQFEADKS